MVELFKCSERETLSGGRFRQTFGLRPISYDDGHGLARIDSTWLASGVAELPHKVAKAELKADVGPDGMRRLYFGASKEEFIEIGAPLVNDAVTYAKIPYLTSAARVSNKLAWNSANTEMRLVHAGHFVKAEVELFNGYAPQTMAFPLALHGLTLKDGLLLREGKPVATLREPVVYDATDELRTRQTLRWELAEVNKGLCLVLSGIDVRGMVRPVVDPTLTLQPDGTDGVDTILLSKNFQTNNLGVNSSLLIGSPTWDAEVVSRSLLKFDLASLPSDATITAATLSLYCTDDYATNARTVRVYRQKRAWVEGTRDNVDDNPATGATWVRYDTTNNWSTAGGFHADDCEQTDIGSRAFSATETLNEFKDFSLTPTSKADLDLGNGWMVKADTESSDCYYFASSDSGTAGNRPELVVEYTAAASGIIPVLMAQYRMRR